MPFDGLTIHCLIKEMEPKLRGGKVEQVFQHSSSDLTVVVYSRSAPGRTSRLFISASAGRPALGLTETTWGNPPSPPPFCLGLRKHLVGARILGVAPVSLWERVVALKFSSGVTLYVELTGKYSNIVLVGPDGKIIDTLRKTGPSRSQDDCGAQERVVYPGASYSLPPSPGKINPCFATAEQVVEALSAAGDEQKAIQKWLVDKFQGISPTTAKECLCRTGDPRDAEAIAAALRTLAEQALSYDPERAEPRLVKNAAGMPKDFTFVPYLLYAKEQQVKTKTLIEAADQYVCSRILRERQEELRRRLLAQATRALERARRKLANKLQDYEQARAAPFYRKAGEILLACAGQVPPGASQAELPDLHAMTEAQATGPSESVPTVRVELDPRLSPHENARLYFRKYEKAKRAMELIEPGLRESTAEVERLEGIVREVSGATTIEQLQKLQETLGDATLAQPRRPATGQNRNQGPESRPLRFRSSEGLTIIVGQNQDQNDYVTFCLAGPSDIWLHARGVPGAHVILKVTKKKQLPQKSLAEAARLAAYFSKNRDEPNVTVDYALRSNVWKPKGARPGAVLYTNYRSLVVRPEPPPTES